MSPDRDTHAVDFRWLVQLRWGAIVGQSLVILLVARLLDIELPLTALFGIIAVEAASNLGCALWLQRRRGRGEAAPEWFVAALMALDILLLTLLLQLSGGSANPFNFLYLVHVTLAAVVLRPRWTWGLALMSTGCFALLFGEPLGLSTRVPHMDHATQMDMHLRGMWVAYAVAVVFIVYFVGRVQRALAARDAQLALERDRRARGEKLASLATLAAGAAHELSTPLATIAVAAGEIDAALGRDDRAAMKDDARLIQDEVRRCRNILDQMATESGDSPGEAPSRVQLRSLLEQLGSSYAPMDVDVASDLADRSVNLPLRATGQVLRGLLDNARQASSDDDVVTLSARRDDADHLVLEVRDRGAGMSPDVLARAGEPFFTTKEPGKGMGLGLFLAHALADRLGGRLDVQSSLGQGTTARLVLPDAPDATIRHIAEDHALVET